MKEKDYYLEICDDDLDNEEVKILFDSKKKNRKRKRKSLKFWYLILFVVLIYLFYDSLIMYFLSLLKKNPTLYSYYLFVENQISRSTILGLLFVSFLGSLFFLVLPSEAIFIYYLSQAHYNFVLIIAITLLGTLFGLSFNYFFGKLLGERILRWLFKKNFERYKNKIEKYGGYVLFFGNIFPGPIEVLAVFYGGFKFDYFRFIYLSFMGRMVKYVGLFLLYSLFWSDIVFTYEETIKLFSLISSFLFEF